MPIDFDAVRAAYSGRPLSSPPDHIPTTEEVLAEHERVRLRCRLDLGLDPSADGVGESGSLIGGRDKSLTIFSRPIERLLRIEPMPLDWFDYSQARSVWPGPLERETAFLDGLIARHLAGFANRPTSAELAAWLRGPEGFPRKRAALYSIFETIWPAERPQLLSEAHLSVYQVARSILVSGSRAPGTVRWLHQFAVEPGSMPPG